MQLNISFAPRFSHSTQTQTEIPTVYGGSLVSYQEPFFFLSSIETISQLQ